MVFPVITAKFTALFLLAFILLTAYVVARRFKKKIGLGIGDDDVLHRRVRAHGNFIEYVPLSLIALALIEIGGAAIWQVCSLGTLLLVGRVAHATGLMQGISRLRIVGMLATLTMLILSAVILLLS